MLAAVTLPSIPWLGCAPYATRQRLCPDQAERLCQHAQQLHSLVLEHGSDSLTRAMAAPVRQTYSTRRSRGRRVTSNRRVQSRTLVSLRAIPAAPCPKTLCAPPYMTSRRCSA